MKKISTEEIKHIVKLSELNLSSEEVEKYKSQLSAVVDFVSQLSEVDTKDVEPTSQTTGLINVLRPGNDIKASLGKEEILSGKDDTYNDYFKVKGVLEKKEE
jgi:aspartyl-tRNA(Asn)/glutamyl-tRNA(Gln) amidotransferase subunit C